MIGECLHNFVEEEWASLWIKITRNNLFFTAPAEDQEPSLEEEKDELQKQLDAHRATYGG